MCRIPLLCLIFAVSCLAACQKSYEYGPAYYKAQAKIDDSILSQYIRQNNLTGIAKHVQNNDTIGVYYIVLQPGQSNTLYTAATSVTVGDTGRLITKGLVGYGNVFNETDTIHPQYPIGSMILGWQLGIPEIGNGGEVRLLVPSRYAYGPYAHPERGLPANAILDFTIKIYNVTN
jgi:FKBP-type peptidyl-prolyl cis-trans isomerase FkpA